MVTSAPRKSSAKPSVRAAVKAAVAPAKKSVTPKSAMPIKSAAAAGKSTTSRSATKPGAQKIPKARAAEKIKKAKLVRDSFTMPETEYAALGEVKKACLKAGFEVKKSELLRIGVALVRKLSLSTLKKEAGALAPLKPGRPRKEKAAEK